MSPPAPAFTLPRVDGPPVSLDEVRAGGPAVLVFAHADCPTSALALRRLAGAPAGDARLVVIAQERAADAVRMARRARIDALLLVDQPPCAVSRAFGVAAVPTAFRVDAGGALGEPVVGWDRPAYERLLCVELEAEPPDRKPGCGSRVDEPPAVGGLDEMEDMFERGFTDGLPVVPPTPERVDAMLGGRDPHASLGRVPPAHGEATLERVAACAVLAGCRPAAFPVVVAAVEATLDPAFNAHGVGVTTQPAAPIVIVNGPVRDALGLNSGMGVLGPGARANMTIGRALRLVLALTGGAAPGGLDRSTLGSPGKIGLCVAENEEASPWPPLHVARGVAAGGSAVTVVACDAPLSVSDHRSRTPEELAMVLARAAEAQWSPFWWPMDDVSVFVICPEHARLFGDAGWTRERLRDALYASAVRPAGELRHGETTPLVRDAPDDLPVHKWTAPERIMILCAGGEAGRYSAVLGPCDGMGTAAITREVRWTM